MKHINWNMLAIFCWTIYFQIFVFTAFKRLLESLTVQTVISVLSTLILSVLLFLTLMLKKKYRKGEAKCLIIQFLTKEIS